MRIINFPLREYAEYSLSLIHFIHGNPYKDDAKTRKCFEIQCWFLQYHHFKDIYLLFFLVRDTSIKTYHFKLKRYLSKSKKCHFFLFIYLFEKYYTCTLYLRIISVKTACRNLWLKQCGRMPEKWAHCLDPRLKCTYK